MKLIAQTLNLVCFFHFYGLLLQTSQQIGAVVLEIVEPLTHSLTSHLTPI